MSNAWRGASCTWPTTTQPTLLTYCRCRNPVESVTRTIGDAYWLAQLDACCRVSLSVGIVRVRLLSPLLASYRQTVTLCSSTFQNICYFMHCGLHNIHCSITTAKFYCTCSNTMVNVISSKMHKTTHMSNTKATSTCCQNHIYNTQKPFHRKTTCLSVHVHITAVFRVFSLWNQWQHCLCHWHILGLQLISSRLAYLHSKTVFCVCKS